MNPESEMACVDCPGHGGSRAECCELVPPPKAYRSPSGANPSGHWVTTKFEEVVCQKKRCTWCNPWCDCPRKEDTSDGKEIPGETK
jgi:hypothetical protein